MKPTRNQIFSQTVVAAAIVSTVGSGQAFADVTGTVEGGTGGVNKNQVINGDTLTLKVGANPIESTGTVKGGTITDGVAVLTGGNLSGGP